MTDPPGQAASNREGPQDVEARDDRHEAIDLIQPHGCMLVCGMPGWVVVAGSANCSDYLGQGLDDLLGRQLDNVLPHQLVHDLRNVLQSAMGSGRVEHLLDVPVHGPGHFDLALHIAGQQAVIELVPRRAEDAAARDTGLLIRSMVGRLVRAKTLDRCLALAVNQVRAVTGFDRVTVSQIRQDGTGQVLAEAVRTGLPSFAGLRYRISDLSEADQALFKRAGLRVVPDTDYVPVPVLCAPASPERTEMALAVLRGVDPDRLSDLRELGARAALTIPLLDGDRLWGLVTCHNAAPRPLPAAVANMLDLFGQVLGMQIAIKEAGETQRTAEAARSAASRLLAEIPPAGEFLDAFPHWAGTLMELVPCDGVGLWSGTTWIGIGLSPHEADRDALLQRVDVGRANAGVSASDDVVLATPDGTVICGVMAVRLLHRRPDVLMFFRGETVETLVWSLDPYRPRASDPAMATVPPVAAVERREEVRRGRSLPWRPAELQIAESLRVALLEALLECAERSR